MAATDRLRERWERITPRERMLVTALAATAVVLVLGWVWITISSGLDAIDARNQKKRDALRALDTYRRDKAMGLGADEAARPKVDIPGQPIELESYLERIAKDVGAEIPGYNSLPEAAKGDFQQVSTKVQIKGLDILQLKDLLYKIETGGGGAVIVEELHVKREFREEGKLEATLVVSTFYDKAAEADTSAAPAGEDGDDKGKGKGKR